MDKSTNLLLFCFNRNIPLAIMISMPIITILYLLVNVSYFSVMSMEDLLNSPAVGIVSVRDWPVSFFLLNLKKVIKKLLICFYRIETHGK